MAKINEWKRKELCTLNTNFLKSLKFIKRVNHLIYYPMINILKLGDDLRIIYELQIQNI